MTLPPPLDHLDADDLAFLDAHLEPVSYAAGTCIFHSGEPGDSCLVIDAGDVRLEIGRAELDSEAVLAYLEPGSLLGELALLDDQPRSVSAWAETAVTGRRLTSVALADIAERQPRLAGAVLHALGRDAARKLRRTNARLAEFIVPEGGDTSVDDTVARAWEAQRAFDGWDEARVDALLLDLATAIAERAREFAEATVAETGIGNVAHKTEKNVVASLGVFRSFAGRPGRGIIAELTERGITEVASPAGVVFGLVPQTNPVATAIFKALIALKGRNAIILSYHRSCRELSETVGTLLHGVMDRHGAPRDLLQWVRGRTSRKTTQDYMSHPGVSLVLATGGAAMVKAAYSSGTPAIGVGPGNTPCLVTASADLTHAARSIVASKSFDNGLICGAEHNLVVEAAAAEEFTRALVEAGAAVLSPDEAARFMGAMVDPRTHGFRAIAVGQPAAAIAGRLGIARPFPIQVIVVPMDAAHPDWGSPLTGEKMLPVLSLFVVADFEAGIALSLQLLAHQGAGHTAIIHTTDRTALERFALAIPASRVLVNSPGAQGVCGATTGLDPSFTLGCGTFGGNSTTDNVTWRHLVNVKHVARFVAPGVVPPPAPAVASAAMA